MSYAVLNLGKKTSVIVNLNTFKRKLFCFGMAGMGQLSPSLNTPLAAMLPPELKDADVTKYFPEFRKNQVDIFTYISIVLS
jgi:hypothetical protein